jgi:hypothetical protein
VRRFQRLALAAGAAASFALPGAAAESAVSLRGTLSLGVDSNARRIFGTPLGDVDAVGSGLLEAVARVSPGPLDLTGSYLAAARKFFQYASHDTLSQEVAADLRGRPLGTVQVAVGGRVKDRRGGPRRYSDLQSALALRWRAVPEPLPAGCGWRVFPSSAPSGRPDWRLISCFPRWWRRRCCWRGWAI